MLALTWGLVHFLTQDFATGIYGIALSVVMGAVHVLTCKNLLMTYPLLLVLFILCTRQIFRCLEDPPSRGSWVLLRRL